MPRLQPFGLWQSPLSAVAVARKLRLEDVQWNDEDATLVWLEGRSGKGVLVARGEEGATREVTDEHNVRAGVGYGGGDFAISQGIVIYAASDGCLYRCSLGYSVPKPITPPFGKAAAPKLSPDGRWVVYVFSDGENDCLALVDIEGKDWPVKLAQAADFYMQPAWHPDGQRLAWIEWDFPDMPWDSTRLKLGRLEGTPPCLTEEVVIAAQNGVPVSQPQFSPDGRWLSYIRGEGEWDHLELLDLQSGEARALIRRARQVLALPAWIQGQRSYGWSHDSRRIFYINAYSGRATLWSLKISDETTEQIDVAPYTWISQLSVSRVDDRVAFIASAPAIPDRVVHWDGHRLYVDSYSDPESFDPSFFSSPNEITWQAPDGTAVYANFYPPANPNFYAEGLPPAIIFVHGGPTSIQPVNYLSERAYFTSRGYAWLELNYRGSACYGRSYERALYNRWGDADTEDAAGAAHALADKKLADAGRLVLRGGSAGGYLVLNALVRYPGLFKAGICLYGVSNLFALNMDTHKFEKRYNDKLVGVLPEAADRFHAWSPCFHAERIKDALAIFQGSEDKVVPPNQSEEIIGALRKYNVPHIYRLYEGEGHGFRKAETITDYLQQTERFLQQYVLFAPQSR